MKCCIFLLSLLLIPPCTSFAGSPDIVDVHAHFQTSQFNNLAGSGKTAMSQMVRYGIRKSLIMPQPFDNNSARGFHDIEALLFLVREHPDQFSILGGSTLNAMLHTIDANHVDADTKEKFRARAEKIASLGAVGFGEIAILHVSIPKMGAFHRYQNIPANHPLLLLLADVAAERGLPIDVHCDLVPEDMPLPEKLRANSANPDILPENLAALKQFLGYNPKTRIVWSHVGFEPLLTRNPETVRALLKKFPNLYMSFRLNHGKSDPAAAIGSDGEVKKSWKQLIGDFPDRFMLGSDAFYDPNGTIYRGSSEEGMNNLRRLIDALPEPVRDAVAYQNADRVYRLAKHPSP